MSDRQRMDIGHSHDALDEDLYVLFEKTHHMMSLHTQSFKGQVGKVRTKKSFPGGEEWLVNFKYGSRWLRPQYLEIVDGPTIPSKAG